MDASVILSVTVLIMLVTIIIFYYKNKTKNKTTMIALEMTSGGSCVILPIVPLSLCPSYWDITTPLIKKITISSFPFCKLFTVWNNFKVAKNLLSFILIFSAINQGQLVISVGRPKRLYRAFPKQKA